jgi:hypothetical protein
MRARRILPYLAIVALLLSASAAGDARAGHVPEEPSIAALGWIAGVWVMEHGEARTEEHWTDLGGDTYMAISRTVRAGHTVFYEYLRIEQRRDGIYYVAQPKNRLPVDFRLTSLSGQEAVFENPNHDFPQRIVYRKNGDGTLTARIEGRRQGQTVSQEFHFRSLGRPAPQN